MSHDDFIDRTFARADKVKMGVEDKVSKKMNLKVYRLEAKCFALQEKKEQNDEAKRIKEEAKKEAKKINNKMKGKREEGKGIQKIS